MPDNYQTSDNRTKDLGPQAIYDLAAGQYDTSIDGPLPSVSTGYSGFFDIDISDLGLQNSIIDVDVWRELVSSAGGGNNRYEYLKLPYTSYLANSTVGEAAWFSVFYVSSIEKGGDEAFVGPSTLRIYYRNNTTSTAYPVFYYKISNRGVLSL